MICDLEIKLEKISRSKLDRETLVNEIAQKKSLFKELIIIALDVSSQNHVKACWVLEQLTFERIHWWQPHLCIYFDNAHLVKNESALRTMSKIGFYFADFHETALLKLKKKQLEKLTEMCFDWLTTNVKVATKCYAIRALFEIGNHINWIHTELKPILEKDYEEHSAAYKAVTREILKKIK